MKVLEDDLQTHDLRPVEEYTVRWALGLPIPEPLQKQFAQFGNRIWRQLGFNGMEKVQPILRQGGYYDRW